MVACNFEGKTQKKTHMNGKKKSKRDKNQPQNEIFYQSMYNFKDMINKEHT